MGSGAGPRWTRCGRCRPRSTWPVRPGIICSVPPGRRLTDYGPRRAAQSLAAAGTDGVRRPRGRLESAPAVAGGSLGSPHHPDWTRRSGKDPARTGARARDRGRWHGPCGARAAGGNSGYGSRRGGDCRGPGARRHPGGGSAEAGEDRVGRHSDAARPRQLRAGPRGGAAHRGDPVVGSLSSRAGHEPRPAPPARRTRIRRGVPRSGHPSRRTVAWRSRALTGRAAVPRPRSRRRTRLPPDARQRPDGHGDLPAARRPAARARAGGAVAEGALARRPALAPRARRAALSCRAARSSGAAADDERDRRVELSAARCERTARVPATRRAARAFLDRPGSRRRRPMRARRVQRTTC